MVRAGLRIVVLELLLDLHSGHAEVSVVWLDLQSGIVVCGRLGVVKQRRVVRVGLLIWRGGVLA